MRQQPRRNGRGQAALAFALGAAAGSVIALLYAPASGQATRRRIVLKAREVRRRAARKLGQTQKVLAYKAGQVRETATEWIADHMPSNGHGRRTSHRRTLRHA